MEYEWNNPGIEASHWEGLKAGSANLVYTITSQTVQASVATSNACDDLDAADYGDEWENVDEDPIVQYDLYASLLEDLHCYMEESDDEPPKLDRHTEPSPETITINPALVMFFLFIKQQFCLRN